MAANQVPVNNNNIMGQEVNDTQQANKLIMIAKKCRPEDLYKLISTSQRIYSLVMPNMYQIVRHYATVLPLDVEKFMWNLFDNENKVNVNKEQLFIKMLMVHGFAKSNFMEQLWAANNLNNNHDFGPLPQDPTELYIKKFQAGILTILYNYNVYQSCLFSYDLDNYEVFDFLLKFINKYTHVSHVFQTNLISHIEDFLEQNMNFEWVDNYIQEAVSYGATEEDVFSILIDEEYIDEYRRLLYYGVDPKRAKEDVENDEYTDHQLETYNEVRHIIGNDLAHHYILDQQLDIQTVPNFLEKVNHLLSIGINDTERIDEFLANPNVIF